MKLTQEQQALLNGEKGQTMAKVMKTLVMYGDIFGAEKLVPVTSRYNHLVTSFGLKALGPVYEGGPPGQPDRVEEGGQSGRGPADAVRPHG